MISFNERVAGITVATLSNRYGTAEISLYGAHILSYTPEGEGDVLFMSSASAFEPGKPIRGGIPVCFPWFGPRFDNPALPQHGFARTSDWKIVSFEDAPEGSTLVLGLSDTEESREMWPHQFAVALAVSVGERLTVTLSVTNTGDESLSFTDALHTYFRIPDISMARVSGLQGTDLYDRVGAGAPAAGGEPWPRKKETGVIAFTAEIDRVYLSDNDRKIEAVGVGAGGTATGGATEAAGKGAFAGSGAAGAGKGFKPVIVKSEGFPDSVVWNPGETKGEAIPDLGAGEWRKFVCVETGAVFTHAVTVEPGATVYQAMTIETGK